MRKAIVIEPVPRGLDVERLGAMLQSRGVLRVADGSVIVFPRNSACRRQIVWILARVPVDGLAPRVVALSPREFPVELAGEPRSRVAVIVDPLPAALGERELADALTNLGGYEMHEGPSGVEVGARRVVMRFERVKGHKIALKILRRHKVGGVMLSCVKCGEDEIPDPLEPGIVQDWAGS
jgi:hypothetical protein